MGDTKEHNLDLDKYEQWMDHDIETLISGGCNISCAAMLGIFIEVLGGFSDLAALNEKGKGKHRFEEFMRKWLPRGYIKLNDKLVREKGKDKSFYSVFRSSLVHSFYFGKLKVEIDTQNPTSRCLTDSVLGIREADDGSERLIINVNALAYDIKKARDQLFEEIRK